MVFCPGTARGTQAAIDTFTDNAVPIITIVAIPGIKLHMIPGKTHRLDKLRSILFRVGNKKREN